MPRADRRRGGPAVIRLRGLASLGVKSVPPMLALAPFAVVALVVGVRVGTPILSHDDIYRTLFAYGWAREPYFFTERLVWLPFPLMVMGLAIRLTGEAFWSGLAVDVVASAIAIWYVFRLTERCFGRLAAWIAAALFGLTPWIVFLALSRYGEPIFLAATAIGAFHWLGFAGSGKGREIAWASLAFTAAVLSRYEAWPLGVAFTVHVAAAWWGGVGTPARSGRRPTWPALWAGLPLLAMGIWVGKNLVVYGHPVYGGAFGFLPAGAPAGVWGGARLTAEYVWQMNPVVSVLGLAGCALHHRRAPLVWRLAALGTIVPWYTVSLFPVDVALHIRLMAVPVMFLAPFAGALVARTIRPHRLAVAVAGLLVAGQLAMDLRLEYPSAPLPMTLLARRLYRNGDLDRFDTLYVQSDTATGYADEVRVGTNFRGPVHVLPLDPPSAPWPETSSDAKLVLNDGRIPPSSGAGEAFVVSRVGRMTAWGICQRRGHSRGVARRARSRVGSSGEARDDRRGASQRGLERVDVECLRTLRRAPLASWGRAERRRRDSGSACRVRGARQYGEARHPNRRTPVPGSVHRRARSSRPAIDRGRHARWYPPAGHSSDRHMNRSSATCPPTVTTRY